MIRKIWLWGKKEFAKIRYKICLLIARAEAKWWLAGIPKDQRKSAGDYLHAFRCESREHRIEAMRDNRLALPTSVAHPKMTSPRRFQLFWGAAMGMTRQKGKK